VALRTGIDMVSVDVVRDSLETHGGHYLRRVYTEREVADCEASGTLDAARLAARFAAKEAALKVLRPAETGIPWHEIEVRRSRDGWVELALAGAAAALASEQRISELALSITHEGGFASAIVVAQCA
jgi:holo-[acyl-carrier protein] synthase